MPALVSFPALLVAVLMTIVFLICVNYKILSDPDIWWHLRNAQILASSGSLLRSDVYSFTIHGKPWIDAEWIAELIYYVAWKYLGLKGLFLVSVSAIEAIVLGIFYLAYDRSKSIAASLFTCGAFFLLMTVSLGPRTLLFGWIFLICEMIVLWRFVEGKNQLWILPLLFALWVNTHGSWPIGVLLLLIYTGCGVFSIDWVAGETTQWNRTQLHSLLKVGAFSLLALMLNPYGWRACIYPFQMLFGHKLMVSVVEEWLPLDFHAFRGKLLFGMLVLLAILQLIRGSKWKLHDLLFLVLAVYLAFTYSRFVVLGGIALCPLLAAVVAGTGTASNSAQRAGSGARYANKLALNAVLILALLGIVSYRFPSDQRLRQEANEGYPSAALPYLRSTHLRGPLLNYYEWGGYLIWNAPELPVFIDTMTEGFDREGVLADYLRILKVDESLEVMRRYGIRYVLFPRKQALSYLLLHSPGWKVNYDDGQTILLERAGRGEGE